MLEELNSSDATIHALALRCLSRAPVFRVLSPVVQRAMYRDGRTRIVSEKEVLWRRGETVRDIGVVLTGSLKLVWTEGGVHSPVDIALPCEVQGEVGFATDGTYQYDVVGLNRGRVLLVPADHLRRLLMQPSLALALAADLAGQVRRLSGLLCERSHGDVETRLARLLLRLAGRAGQPFPGGTLVPLKLRRGDLAMLAATTLESTSRRLNAWHRRGVIRLQPTGFVIRDITELRRVALSHEPPVARGAMPEGPGLVGRSAQLSSGASAPSGRPGGLTAER